MSTPFDIPVAVDEKEILKQFFVTTNGPNWLEKNGWESSSELKRWKGISLNQRGRVTKMSLRKNNLDGEIPGCLGNLTNLKFLILSQNCLSWKIPLSRPLKDHESGAFACADGGEQDCKRQRIYLEIDVDGFGQLIKLEVLKLHDCNLSGKIPESLFHLFKLTELELGRNKLTGNIPTSLSQLINLTALDLGHNQFTGDIPMSMGQLSNLKKLYLLRNTLSGELPASMGQLSYLREVWLSYNQLSGKHVISVCVYTISPKLYRCVVISIILPSPLQQYVCYPPVSSFILFITHSPSPGALHT
jgi:Leucine-rich repeat (LRR) protein